MKSQSAQPWPATELKKQAKVPSACSRNPVVGLPPSSQAPSDGVAKPSPNVLLSGLLGRLAGGEVPDDVSESGVSVGSAGAVGGGHDALHMVACLRPIRRALCPPPEHCFPLLTFLAPAPLLIGSYDT
jgi:hypothetical protein